MNRLLLAWRFVTALILAAGFAAGGALAGPYPVAGPDDDPDHCSSRKNQPVLYCVTPPPGMHCQEIMSESAPLYLGYRYECDPAPESAAAGSAPDTGKKDK
jgi:hypothetical protein